MRLILLIMLQVALVGMGGPRQAVALSCIPLSDVIAGMDVIVRGTITAMPADGVLELAVVRYYKEGDGPVHLRAEVPGLGQGQRMDWHAVPAVGDELIIGFKRRGDALINQACSLFVQLEHGQEPPQDVQDLIGEGRAPHQNGRPRPIQEPESQPAGAGRAPGWSLGVGLVVLGIGFGSSVWRWRRRAPRRKPTSL